MAVQAPGDTPQPLEQPQQLASAPTAAPAPTVPPEPTPQPTPAPVAPTTNTDPTILDQHSASAQVDPLLAAKVAAAGVSPVVAQEISRQYPSANLDPGDHEAVAPFALKAAQAAFEAVHGVPPTPAEAITAATQGPQAVTGPSAISASITRGATELGVSPQHLAAIIGYETAGTYSPDKSNPWGYKGLIQFSPDKWQSGAFGLKQGMGFDDQMSSVVQYMKAAGVKPGMGIHEMYQAIDGGRVGAGGVDFGSHLTPDQTVDQRIAPQWLPKAAKIMGGAAPDADRQGVTWGSSTPTTPITDADRAQEKLRAASDASGVAGSAYEYIRHDSLTANLLRDAQDYSRTPDPSWSLSEDTLKGDPRFQALPSDLQNQAGYLRDSVSREDYEARINSLQADASYQQRAADSGASGSWGRFLGGFIDPVNVIAGLATGGLAPESRIARVLWDGAAGAGLGGADAAYRQRYSTDVDAKSILWGAAMGAGAGLTLGAAHAAFHPAIKPEVDVAAKVNERAQATLRAQVEGKAEAAAIKAGEPATPLPPTYLEPQLHDAQLMTTANALDEGGVFGKAKALEDQIDGLKMQGEAADPATLSDLISKRSALTPKLSKLLDAAQDHLSAMGIERDEPGLSTVGAAHVGNTVEPVRGDIYAMEHPANQAAYSNDKVALKSVRVDLAKDLRGSPNPYTNAFGTYSVFDSVGNKDHSPTPIDIGTQTQNELTRTAQASSETNLRANFQSFAAEQKLSMKEKPAAEAQFRKAVSDAVEAKDTEGINKHVLSAANHQRKLYGEWADHASDPSLGDGTTRDPIQGAPEKNPAYLPRIIDWQKWGDMLHQIGDSKMRNLFKSSVRDELGEDVEEALVTKIGNAAFKGYKDVQAGQRSFRDVSGEDPEAFAGLLREVGVSEEDIKSIAGKLKGSPNPEGPSARLKVRTPMNVNFRDADGNSLRDVMERDAGALQAQYSRTMGGQIGLSRIRIPNHAYDPELHGIGGEEEWAQAPFLQDGLQKAGELDNFIARMKAFAAQEGIKQEITNRDETNIRLAHDSIKGVMQESDKGRLGASMRILGNYNLSRLMGMVGLAHVPIAAQVMAQAGVKASLAALPGFRAFRRSALDGTLTEPWAREMEALTGIATEWQRGYTNKLPMDDIGNAVSNSPWRAFEVGTQKLARYTTAIGGMAPIMTFLQRWAGRAIQVRMAMDALGGTAELSANRLAAMGVGAEMRTAIMENIRQHSGMTPNSSVTAGKMADLNLDQWDSSARHAFLTMTSRFAGRVTQENDPGMMITVFGSRWGKMLTQFRSFLMGAYANNTLHNLHMRDGASGAGLMAAGALGAMSYTAQSYLQSMGRSDQQDFLAKRLTVGRMAAAAIHRSGSFSVLPSFADTGLEMSGFKPFFDVRSTGLGNGGIGSIPAADAVNSLVKASRSLVKPAWGGGWDQQDVRNLLAPLPFQNTLPAMTIANGLMSGLPKHVAYPGDNSR